MSRSELQVAASLASIFFLRMFGLFMLLPVLALHVDDLRGATPLLIGIALGGYGITQALLQIPFGSLSDRLGRKPVIAAGLLLFAAGSVIAALADSVTGVIAGRMLQGAGAIAAATMALAADLTRESQRTRAMAILGISIGAAFLLGVAAGPALDAVLGLRGVFGAGAALALLALLVLVVAVPEPPRPVHHLDCQSDVGQLARCLRHPDLLRLNLGVFCLHLNVTSLFVVLPMLLRDHWGLPGSAHWQVYVPVMLASVALMLPLLRAADRPRRLRLVLMVAAGAMAAGQLLLARVPASLLGGGAVLALYFAGFNLLEAGLPATVSKAAPVDARGTALGVFSTSQFLGAFAGGILGGLILQGTGPGAVLGLGAAVTGLWLIVAAGLGEPARLRDCIVGLPGGGAEEVRERLRSIAGVVEAVVSPEEGIAYLRVDPQRLDRGALDGVAGPARAPGA